MIKRLLKTESVFEPMRIERGATPTKEIFEWIYWLLCGGG